MYTCTGLQSKIVMECDMKTLKATISHRDARGEYGLAVKPLANRSVAPLDDGRIEKE